MFKVNERLIRAEMLKRGWTITDLTHETRLNERTCRKLVKGGMVNLKCIAVVAGVFGVNGEDLILKEEIYD